MAHYIADFSRDMESPTMLYKHPGPHKIDGDFYDYIIVDADEVGDKIREGWARTLADAKKKPEVVDDSEIPEVSTELKKRGRKKS